MFRINFNPNLNHNDSLSPEEIDKKVEERNKETRSLTEKAYLTGDVPVTASERAAEHSSITRQTAEGKKARRDAGNWWSAQSNSDDCDDD